MKDIYKIEIWVTHRKSAEFTSTSFKAIRKWFDDNYRDSYDMGFCTYYISKNGYELDWRLLNN